MKMARELNGIKFEGPHPLWWLHVSFARSILTTMLRETWILLLGFSSGWDSGSLRLPGRRSETLAPSWSRSIRYFLHGRGLSISSAAASSNCPGKLQRGSFVNFFSYLEFWWWRFCWLELSNDTVSSKIWITIYLWSTTRLYAALACWERSSSSRAIISLYSLYCLR